MSESLTLYKLIILYMLRRVTFPMTNAQISSFILDQGYTTYFHLQQAISEMVEANLLRVETIRNSSHYHMTEEGLNTITYFEKEISDAIKEDIHTFLEQNSYELRNEVFTQADYYKDTNQDYIVRCQVKERDTDLIVLNLTVPTEDTAKVICNNWTKKNQEIYAHLMKELLS